MTAASDSQAPGGYRGRLAPTPSGLLHRGHARTFWLAWVRTRRVGGRLVMRLDDLDRPRCPEPFAAAALADLAWLGLDWDEGPDRGGPSGPYRQHKRGNRHLDAFHCLLATGLLYPSPHSRRDVQAALHAPHEGDSEPIFPPSLRPTPGTPLPDRTPGPMNWRFRVPDGMPVTFADAAAGPQSFVAGRDFGDFLVWRRDGFPSYELACAADDLAMGITEVVRGADLLLSTARQILLYRALGAAPPAFCHAPLVRDASGRRLAKRDADEGLAALRARGVDPAELRAAFEEEIGSLAGGI